jgi:hypothetical protein
MRHRHIDTDEWTLMAIDSLFDRGKLEDWREFVRALKRDRELGERALRMAEGHEDTRSAALARVLVGVCWPELGIPQGRHAPA